MADDGKQRRQINRKVFAAVDIEITSYEISELVAKNCRLNLSARSLLPEIRKRCKKSLQRFAIIKESGQTSRLRDASYSAMCETDCCHTPYETGATCMINFGA
jgi:hypothetical protein